MKVLERRRSAGALSHASNFLKGRSKKTRREDKDKKKKPHKEKSKGENVLLRSEGHERRSTKSTTIRRAKHRGGFNRQTRGIYLITDSRGGYGSTQKPLFPQVIVVSTWTSSGSDHRHNLSRNGQKRKSSGLISGTNQHVLPH